MDVNITLTENDLKILNDALIERPFKEVAPLINKINEQILNSRNSDKN